MQKTNKLTAGVLVKEAFDESVGHSQVNRSVARQKRSSHLVASAKSSYAGDSRPGKMRVVYERGVG